MPGRPPAGRDRRRGPAVPRRGLPHPGHDVGRHAFHQRPDPQRPARGGVLAVQRVIVDSSAAWSSAANAGPQRDVDGARVRVTACGPTSRSRAAASSGCARPRAPPNQHAATPPPRGRIPAARYSRRAARPVGRYVPEAHVKGVTARHSDRRPAAEDRPYAVLAGPDREQPHTLGGVGGDHACVHARAPSSTAWCPPATRCRHAAARPATAPAAGRPTPPTGCAAGPAVPAVPARRPVRRGSRSRRRAPHPAAPATGPSRPGRPARPTGPGSTVARQRQVEPSVVHGRGERPRRLFPRVAPGQE